MNSQKNRDFIDFLVLLNNKKLVLVILMPIIIAFGVYFSSNSLSTFSFQKKIQVAEENLYAEIVFYQMSLLEDENSYAEKNPLFMSRKSSGDLTESSLNDIYFYDEMFEAYKNSLYYDDKQDNQRVYESLLKAILFEVNTQTLTYTLKVSTNYSGLTRFIESNITQILNDRIKKAFDLHLKSVTESTMLILKSQAEQDIIVQKYELAGLVLNSRGDLESNLNTNVLDSISIEDAKKVSSKWNQYILASAKKLPDTNFNFFIQKPAKVKEIKGLNLYFSIIFSIFISIFLFFLYVLFYDLFDQVNRRVNN